MTQARDGLTAGGLPRRGLIFVFCLIVLGCALLLGGGANNGLIGDTLIELAAVPLAVLCVRRLAAQGFACLSTGEWLLVAGIILIPLLQLVPLPPALWTRLPHADVRLAAFALLGQELDARPVSLTPQATALAALSLVPPICLFIGMRQLHASQRRVLVLLVVVIALASVFLGFLQLSGGQQSRLRLYTETNPDDAVGFFANRNHFAALLYVAVLLTAPWALDSFLGILAAHRHRGIDAARIVVGFASGTLLFLFGVAEIITRSRAGVALTLLAAVLIAILVVGDRRNRWRKASLAVFGVGVVAVILFAAQFGLDQFVDRLSVDARNDTRLVVARHTLDAAVSFLPFGSGIGSFQSLYGMWETPSDLIANVYINEAHDDVLQLALEAGVPGLLVLLGFGLSVVAKAVTLFTAPDQRLAPLDVALARTALFAIILLGLHSFVDYPLRSSAGMALLALCGAMARQPAAPRAAAADPTVDTAVRRRVRVASGRSAAERRL